MTNSGTSVLRLHRHIMQNMICGLAAEADALFVHMLAANEGARAFYEQQGFVLDQQESSNRAHYR